MAVVLVPGGSREPSIGPQAASSLAGLGVTRVAVTRDADGLAVVLDGWSFDPDRSLPDAVAALGCSGTDCRALRPVAQVSLNGEVRLSTGMEGR